jgi:hypothetical protein
MNNINYQKEVLQSTTNYVILGVIFVLMCITSSFWGWLYLGIAAEIIVYLSSYTGTVQRVINLQSYDIQKGDMEEEIAFIEKQLNGGRKDELERIKELYDALIQKNIDEGTAEKLLQFYHRAARLLNTIQLLNKQKVDNPELHNIKRQISDIDRALSGERGTSGEEYGNSARYKDTLKTNKTLLEKRFALLQGVGGRIVEMQAQVGVITQSLELLNTKSALDFEDSSVNDLIDELLIQTDMSQELDVRNLQLPNLIKGNTKQNPVEKELIYEQNNRRHTS